MKTLRGIPPAVRCTVGAPLGGIVASLLISMSAAHASPAPVQTFHAPLPEVRVQASLKKIYSSTGSQMRSVISIAVTGNNSIIYYDHWEDGYENDLANPQQRSSEIWDDGNTGNGTPPGIPSDTLNAGAVIALKNLVDRPRNPGVVKFDGRDKMGATKAIAAENEIECRCVSESHPLA